MSFHLIHKSLGRIRDLNYRSSKKDVREGDEWMHPKVVAPREQYVGFRLWADQATGKSVLLLNCEDEPQYAFNSFGRVMDIYANHGPLTIRPWRIFVLMPERNNFAHLYELQFKRDREDYTLIDYAPFLWRDFRQVLGDFAVLPMFDSPDSV